MNIKKEKKLLIKMHKKRERRMLSKFIEMKE